MMNVNHKYVMSNIEMTSLLSWKFRNLTPVGRITVIKTLKMKKVNHLILAIPNPSVEFLIDFESEQFKFSLNNKPYKIKRNG